MSSEVALFDGRRAADDGKVMEGRDGWLFLDHDAAEFVKQLIGEKPFTQDELESWRTTLERRSARLAELGIPYFFLICPESHSVYPEKLPAHVRPAPERPVTQLLAHLEASACPVKPIYPISQLLDAKREHPVYSQTDTHWNAHGAFIGYELLADELERSVPIRRVAKDSLKLRELQQPGDLGLKLTPERTSLQVRYEPDDRRRHFVASNGRFGIGRMIAFACEEAPDTRCVLFGDSSAAWTSPPLSASFRRLVIAYDAAVDLELVKRERADVVISLLTERRMRYMPADPPEDGEQRLAWPADQATGAGGAGTGTAG
jgi:alginate O-acetyltransferase complex protein AlgJ